MRPNLIKRMLLFCAVASMALLLPAAVAAGPQLEMLPSSHDFGEVEVGETATASARAYNTGSIPLNISAIVFSAGSSADFALLTPVVLPCFLPVLDGLPHWLDLDIAYTPSAEGDATAVLEVVSDDPAGIKTVAFDGTGVVAQPSVTIEDILAFFDASVEAGTIVGIGPTDQARMSHLKVFRSTLLLAARAIDDGKTELACDVLERSYLRSDGQLGPKDFVRGPDCAELNTMILQLMVDMGWE